MMLRDNIESTFDISDENIAILYIDSELFLKCLVNLDWGLNISKSSFITPMGIEWDRDALSILKFVHSIFRGQSGWGVDEHI
jgi:hypothetical protein